jgi:hypothetical protein
MAIHICNIPTSFIARPSKIYPNWFEKMPSGNPGSKGGKTVTASYAYNHRKASVSFESNQKKMSLMFLFLFSYDSNANNFSPFLSLINWWRVHLKPGSSFSGAGTLCLVCTKPSQKAKR